jgi:phosphatidylserine/phosphatidylglycerophosphate/cardiolipin synthase-like enzyme
MRVRSSDQGVSVHAVVGCYVVILGMDANSKAAKGLLGFAIQRDDHYKKRKTWLRNPQVFEEMKPPDLAPGESVDSCDAPIQSFLWGDYSVRPGRCYTYTVIPMYGKPVDMRQGRPVVVKIETESEEDSKHAIFFNRGVAGSQAYSRRFGKHRKWYQIEKYGRTTWNEFIKPEEVPDREAWEWLSRGLEEAILGFIGQATGPEYALRAAVYEFEYLPVIQAFEDALERGVDIKITYDAKESTTGPKKATEAALRRIGVRNGTMIKRREQMMIPRTKATISHNKFIVMLKNGEPIQVWTGSANFTPGGIFGQSNVGHLVRDREVARRYLEYWQKLAEDPKKTTSKKDPEVGLRDWNVERQPDLTDFPEPGSITPIFSPRPTLGMLEWYAERLASAKHSVHFTAAFGVAQQLADKLMEKKELSSDHPFLRYVMLESRPSQKSSKKRKDTAAAKGRPLPLDYYDFVAIPSNCIAVGSTLRKRRGRGSESRALEEHLTGLDTHVEFLHTKYMLVDPLTDDPLVITGSANFSEASTRENDENMLVIRGNTRVADIFLGEFMRLFNHFDVRYQTAQMDDEEAERSFYLTADDSWTAEYYQEGSQKQAERLLFR